MLASPRLRFLAVTALVAVVLCGCSSPGPIVSAGSETAASAVPLSQVKPVADPRSFAGPSTATLASASIVPVSENPQQSLPATVTSHDLAGDTPATVTSTDRVLGLSISGSIAATIYGLGLGRTLVGRDVSTTVPEALSLPVVTTGGHSINSESVIALRPTLVITDGTIGPTDVVLQLRDAGIPVVYVKADPSIQGTAKLSRQVAAAMGVPATGDLLATRIEADVAAVETQIATLAPTTDKLRMAFLYLRGSAGIYYLFGEGSGADQIINGLGGIDVAKEINWTGMKPMTDEALIAANPDLILVMSDGIASAGGVDGLLADKPAIGLTNAGKHRRFVDMADGEILGFGPRYPAVLDALARAVYAP